MDATDKLTSGQIKNWRIMLFTIIGPYAYFMPDEEVQRYKDAMQSRLEAPTP
jgi:hypothetical protein